LNLYRRDKGKVWWARFTDAAGQTHRFSTKRPIEDERGAYQVLLKAYQTAMDQTQFGKLPEVTLGEATLRTLDTVENPRTRASYALSRAKLIGDGKWTMTDIHTLSPDMLMSELRTSHISRLVSARQNEGLRANSINIELRFIQRTYNLCQKDWEFAVFQGVSFKALKGFQKTRYFDLEEERCILEALQGGQGNDINRRAYDLFVTLLDTGMRLGEALSLEWSDIRLGQRSIEVYRQKTKIVSTLPISERVANVLERRMCFQRPFGEMDRPVRVLRKAIASTCNTNPRLVAQRGTATVHTCRDTFASRMIMQGLSIYKLSKLLGHASVVMTQKYAHIDQDRVADEARQILDR